MIENLICMLVGYFCGCLSFGYLIGRLYHMDIRQKGSGNAGTTNVLRTLGPIPALITFAGDLIKAIAPILVIRFLVYPDGGWYLTCLYCGLGVVLGHNYPFYLKFKGGKGIAVTAAVVMSAAHPLMIPIGIVIFAAVVALSRYVSLGSLFVAWYIPANTIACYRDNPQFWHMLVISLLFTAFAYFQHRENIVRLLKGEENKLGSKSSE